MFALPLAFAPLLLAVPDRPMPRPKASTSWVGKMVYLKTSGVQLDPSPEPNAQGPAKGGMTATMTAYRVYAERAGHVQVKTREGVHGWVRKTDVLPTKEAIVYFTKLIAATPNDMNLRNRRASALRTIGELDLALKDATEAIRLSASPVLYNNRAIIWHSKKDFERALADYAKAIGMNPRYPLFYVNRAVTLHDKKDYDKAIADATQAIQLQPRNPVAYRIRGISWQGKKDYDKAIEDASRGLEFDAKSSQLHADRGKAWARKKDYAKALADFNDALRLEPNNVVSAADAALWLASCPDVKFRDGKRSLAIAQRAHKQARSNSQVLQALAAAYAETGQFAEAARWQEHALQDPQIANDKKARARLELFRTKKPYRSE